MQKLEVADLNVKYTYGALAISDLSFVAKKGEITCVLGDNESGKTSLLKCLAGLIKPTSGSIIVDGNIYNDVKTQDRDTILIFEDGTFFENRTVKYNLAYPLRIRKTDDPTIDRTISEAMVELGLDTDFLNKKVSKLTNSERVDLSFARAILRRAGLILIDDPFKNLSVDRDQYFCKYSRIIRELSEKSIVIYATKDVNDCIFFDRNTIILNYGICIQQGTPKEIRDNPNSLLSLKKFNSDMCIFDGRIANVDNLTLYYGDKTVILDRNMLISDIYIGKDVLVAEYNNGKTLIMDKDNERIIYFS